MARTPSAAGLERVEGQVWKDDAAPVPDVAAASADHEQESETRSIFFFEMIAAR